MYLEIPHWVPGLLKWACGGSCCSTYDGGELCFRHLGPRLALGLSHHHDVYQLTLHRARKAYARCLATILVENSRHYLKVPEWVFRFVQWLCNGRHCYFGNYDGYILREIGPIDIVLGHVIPKLAGYTRYTLSIEWGRHDLIKVRMMMEDKPCSA